MKSVTIRMLCRMLIVSMLALPFNSAWAGMIGTDQALAATSAQSERAALMSLIGRADVARELSALGVDPEAARARVAAMSDQEVRTLAGRIEAMPAGADGAWGWIIVIALIAGAVYYFYGW